MPISSPAFLTFSVKTVRVQPSGFNSEGHIWEAAIVLGKKLLNYELREVNNLWKPSIRRRQFIGLNHGEDEEDRADEIMLHSGGRLY
ncbi:hypothetical protein F2Q69_00024348 [Brassica cretica]|uniref:Uncharacterized protein n=1 Tax=Brassica cretica TaxID=69181 RepID=A0A8S9QBB6_BRACR|nr:hypothetical protein F2Q69_00024348 [Brassica cretica]